MGYGKGSPHEFSEDNVAQVLAILKVREVFGDGSLARVVLAAGIPQVRRGTPSIRVPEFALSLG